VKSGIVPAYRTRTWVWALLLIHGALGWAATAGAETLFTPRVSARVEYDDNVRFTRTDPASDFVASLRPSMKLSHRTERLQSDTSLAVRALRYAEESDLDREEVWFDSGLSWGLTERLSVQGDASWSLDSALESELQETGLVTEQTDRTRMSGGGGLTFHLTELQDIGGSFSLGRTEYDSENQLDYDTAYAALTWTRRFRNERDSLTLQPYWSSNSSDVSDVGTWGFMVGWSRLLAENWSLTAFLGARYTRTEYRRIQQEVVFDPTLLPAFPFRIEEETVTEEETSWGGVADISVRWTGEAWGVEASYNRDLSYSSLGEPIEQDRLGLSIRRRFDERLSAQCTGTVYRSRYEGMFSNQEYSHFALSPSVSYRLTETHYLSAGFHYDLHEDEAQEPSGVDRKRVWISLDCTFDPPW